MANKIALVTGGGTGIGQASALALAKEDFTLVLSGRNEDSLRQSAKKIESLGRKALVIPTDISDFSSVTALFKKIEDAFGRLDLLFNNAGTGAPAVAFDELKYEHWQHVVAVNLTGSFLCAQQAFKMMKAQTPQGGRIINNGSISATSPRPNSAPYTATKHAITGLTKSMSLDGREHNIICSQIDIGNALTEMTAPMAAGVPQANGDILAEPTMDVQDVARAIVFIANLPLESNVQFMTIMASKMPLIGRG